MKCKGQASHDMGDGQKFCAECGAEGEAPQITKAMCPSCNAEGLSSHKHCAACGGAMVKAEAPLTQDELDRGLDALGLIAKANAALEDDITPGDDDDDGDDGEEVSLLKSELIQPDENGNFDALPILDLLIKANNRQASIIQVLGAEVRALRKDLGVVAKSEELIARGNLARLDSLTEQLGAWSGQARPRKAVVALTTKSIQTGNPNGNDKTGDESLTGNALIAKAVALENQGLLQQDDAGRVAHFANRGASLDQLASLRPDLHARLTNAIGKQKAQAQ